ncbi:MAG: diacylglycerol/lipid kinase family protein, partial [Solirubrobacteraceae bacterium]
AGPRAGTAEETVSLDGVTVLVQNAARYTYFGDRGVAMAPGAGLNSGDLAALVLTGTSPLDMPSLAWRALSERARFSEHGRVRAFSACTRVLVRSPDGSQLPLQVDGDYLGEVTEARYSILPQALNVVA